MSYLFIIYIQRVRFPAIYLLDLFGEDTFLKAQAEHHQYTAHRMCGMECKYRIIAQLILVILVSVGMTAADEVSPDGIGSEDVWDLESDEDYLEESALAGVQPATIITGPDAENSRTRLVLLGTTGGVSWWPETDRASSSSALVIGDTIYLIDIGQGSASRLSEAFNYGDFVNYPDGRIQDGSSTFLEDVKALFITHLHMDHTADYPSLLLIGPGAGLGTSFDPVAQKTVIDPMLVIGPAGRGELEADKTQYIERGGQIISTDSADPALITTNPGTRQMTDLIWQAYAQAINDMTLDNGYPDYTKLVQVREIGGTDPFDIPLPVYVPDPNSDSCPEMEPFEIYRDDLVRVTAILVDHHQVFPSFAFRFDTDDGSVVFSGDTGPDTKGNLQRLAAGADILVHEVIDPAWIDLKFGTPEPGSQMDALKIHMLTSHTSIDKVGMVATECGVPTLVLNHLVPGNTPLSHLEKAGENYDGTLIVGEDLMQIGMYRGN